MKKNILIATTLFFGLIIQGCTNFLEVNPKSSIAEVEVFNSEAGFNQALNGIYSQMAAGNLYGDKLTMGIVSALGQDYALTTNEYLGRAASFDYQSQEVRDEITAIWSSGYQAIAGLNAIILNTEKNRSSLSTTAYAQIKGEALGMRAYMHFDLLRLFGEAYSTGANKKAIPYRTVLNQNPQAPSTTAEVVTFALQDLQEAQELLKGVDSIIVGGAVVDTRRVKMNYYAAKGLEARIKIYAGDKPGAFTAASEVVNSQKFPFVDLALARHAELNIRDRMYFGELIFALRTGGEMEDRVDRYFRADPSGQFAAFDRPRAQIRTIYENSAVDIRSDAFRFTTDRNLLVLNKYWQVHERSITGAIIPDLSPLSYDRLVPLIRLAEMYYIMAETAGSVDESRQLINKVREARVLDPLPESGFTQAKLDEEITKEYRKEFYGEGQLFFYFKRRQITTLPFLSTSVSPAVFKLPLPDAELEFNPTY